LNCRYLHKGYINICAIVKRSTLHGETIFFKGANSSPWTGWGNQNFMPIVCQKFIKDEKDQLVARSSLETDANLWKGRKYHFYLI